MGLLIQVATNSNGGGYGGYAEKECDSYNSTTADFTSKQHMIKQTTGSVKKVRLHVYDSGGDWVDQTLDIPGDGTPVEFNAYGPNVSPNEVHVDYLDATCLHGNPATKVQVRLQMGDSYLKADGSGEYFSYVVGPNAASGQIKTPDYQIGSEQQPGAPWLLHMTFFDDEGAQAYFQGSVTFEGMDGGIATWDTFKNVGSPAYNAVLELDSARVPPVSLWDGSGFWIGWNFSLGENECTTCPEETPEVVSPPDPPESPENEGPVDGGGGVEWPEPPVDPEFPTTPTSPEYPEGCECQEALGKEIGDAIRFVGEILEIAVQGISDSLTFHAETIQTASEEVVGKLDEIKETIEELKDTVGNREVVDVIVEEEGVTVSSDTDDGYGKYYPRKDVV